MFCPLAKNQTIKFTALILVCLLMLACGPENGSEPQSADGVFSISLPASLTGGKTGAAAAIKATGTGVPCAFSGDDIEDPFKNGYTMTKSLIAVVATWTCIADSAIELVNFVPHDGLIHASDENVKGETGYDADEPTHYSVSDGAENQITVRLYYDYTVEEPPTADSPADFFISWQDDQVGTLQGRLIIEATRIDAANRDPAEPSRMRMDFDYTPNQKLINMYLQFDDNPWANGFRIELVKDLTADRSPRVYTAKGKMDMNRQFLANVSITELPDFSMVTVADRLGNGAAAAQFVNVAIPLELTPKNHLGEYLVEIQDRYFFQDDQDWDWIDKNVVHSVYRGQRTTPPTGGTWEPIFNPSLDLIILAFNEAGYNLDPAYFTGGLCAKIGDQCDDFLNAVYQDGFADQEQNQGSDPEDWRSSALATEAYLNSVYPEGFASWDDVFVMSFSPQ